MNTQSTLETTMDTGSMTEDRAVESQFKKGDGCWLERRTGEITFTRGMGMLPGIRKADAGMKDRYFEDQQFVIDLTALAERLGLELHHYSDDGRNLHYMFR